MRTSKFIKNVATTIITYIATLSISIISRKYFLQYLGVEFLGYESLFSNIFTIMATTEMGVAKNISYHLYRAFSENNKKEVNFFYNVYRTIYICIGILILFGGIICSFFLEQFITGNMLNAIMLRVIYFLQLMSILRTYFLSYPRMLFSANQKEYVPVFYDTVFNVLVNVTKIFSMFIFRDYVVYLLLILVGGICSDINIYRLVKKNYAYIKRIRISFKEIREQGILRDVKNFIGHQLAGTVFCGTDSVIIAKILGIIQVGYFNNYMMFKNQIMNIITHLFQPLQASVGSLIYSEDGTKKASDLFYMVNHFAFCLAAFVAVSVTAMAQDVIELLYGREYLLSNIFVGLVAVNLFIEIIRGFQSYFRFVYGEYEKDRKYVIMAALANLVFSIILAGSYGLEGILLGTLIGNLIIWYGNLVFLREKYLKSSVAVNILLNVRLCLPLLLEIICMKWLCRMIPCTLTGLVQKALLCCLVPNFLNGILFILSDDFSTARIYINSITNIVKRKGISK